MKTLRFVDSFIRGRGQIIERVKTGERLGGFIAGAALMYVVFTAVYGVGMGSFRWAHPLLFFSDFAIEDGGTGFVDTMDADTGSFTTRDLRAAPDLAGRAIRFNRTNPTPPYTITRTEEFGPHCRVYVDGPPMVAEDPWMFALVSSLKVPALFLVTLLVCLPALYVLNVAMGWRLGFVPTAAVLVFAIAGTSVVLAVLAPIVIFFTVLTDHYHFMMVLHVLIFALAGAYGVQTLGVGLNGLRQDIQPSQVGAEKPNRRRLIVAWLLLYMFVGCQMAWSLRPWVGTPYIAEFEALRPASSNFYVNVVGSFGKLGDTRR
jgi:hypothetical protein